MKENNPVTSGMKMAHSLRRRLFFVFFLHGFLPAGGVAAFLAGGAILACRLWTDVLPANLLGGIICILFLGAVTRGALYAWRRLPDHRKLLIWLDSASHGGGFLAASLEADSGEWQKFMSSPMRPHVATSYRRGLIVLTVGVLFLCGAIFLPESAVSAQAEHTIDFTQEAAALEEKIEVLEEEALMPEKELADLKDGVEELKEMNDAINPARLFEMHDALSRRIGLAGEEAASRLREENRTMQMLSAALDSLGSLPVEELSPEASSQMSDLLQKLAEDNPDLTELLKQTGNMPLKLDPATMKRLAEAMRDFSGQLEKQLARLAEAKLAKARNAKPGSCKSGTCKSGSCEGGDCTSDLADWLAQNAPGADELMICLMPGTGGVTRGRGDAPLFFSGDTPGSGGKEVDLMLAGDNDPSGSMLVQQFANAPESAAEERREAVAGNLRGGDARIDRNENRIYPAHRAAVERYFKPKKKQDTL